MRLRQALVSDIPAISRIRMNVLENQIVDPLRVAPAIIQDYIENRGRGWVYLIDGDVQGFAIADLKEASVWALFVEPKYEGQGIGRKLHDAMLAWFKSLGVENVTLGTDPGTRAEQFYLCAGWQPQGLDSAGQARFKMQLSSVVNNAKSIIM